MAEAAPSMAAMAPGAATPSREAIKTFLESGIAMMKSTATRDLLKDAGTTEPGRKLIELQRAGWDALGVDRDIGCQSLDRMDPENPDDARLLAVREDFVHTAMRTYLLSLEDKRPKKLEKKKPLPRMTIVEFFDSCNTKMDLPETLEMLRKHMELTKQVPNQVIIDLQRDQLEVLGFEREHGCAMLSRLAQDFPDDQELFRRFAVWQRKAQQTCMRVAGESGMLPQNLLAHNPEMAGLAPKAREEIEAMTPKERGELVEKMQRKVQTFMKLPHENRVQYMQRLSDADKLEILKAQILMASMMQQHMREQEASGGVAGSGTPLPTMAPPSVAPPSQMMM